MGMWHRVGVGSTGDEPDDVSRIHEENGFDFVGNPAEGRPVDNPRVGRVAGNDHLRPVRLRKTQHLVHVDDL